jgi:hypothetical protein
VPAYCPSLCLGNDHLRILCKFEGRHAFSSHIGIGRDGADDSDPSIAAKRGLQQTSKLRVPVGYVPVVVRHCVGCQREHAYALDPGPDEDSLAMTLPSASRLQKLVLAAQQEADDAHLLLMCDPSVLRWSRSAFAVVLIFSLPAKSMRF